MKGRRGHGAGCGLERRGLHVRGGRLKRWRFHPGLGHRKRWRCIPFGLLGGGGLGHPARQFGHNLGLGLLGRLLPLGGGGLLLHLLLGLGELRLGHLAGRLGGLGLLLGRHDPGQQCILASRCAFGRRRRSSRRCRCRRFLGLLFNCFLSGGDCRPAQTLQTLLQCLNRLLGVGREGLCFRLGFGGRRFGCRRGRYGRRFLLG
mmetsp:Transcript_27342/g.64030  ORF Transcript_27342/g.64030 Transcript_27342/m.64030 type:complete len:203 (-) Transcript_27342:355-963(-)